MKKLLIVLASVFLVIALAPVRAETMVIATGEYPPYNSKDYKHFGLIGRIVTEAFKSQGIHAYFQFYPWARAYELSKVGKVDATAQWYHSNDRAADHFYSDPIMEETVVWFHLRDKNFQWKTLKDLQGYRIGAVHGYTYTPEFYRMIEDNELTVEFVRQDELNFRKMLLGRIDIVPEVVDIGFHLMHSNYPPSTVSIVTHHPEPFIRTTTHLLFSKKLEASERRMAAFNKGLQFLRSKGLFEEFLLESRRGQYMPDN